MGTSNSSIAAHPFIITFSQILAAVNHPKVATKRQEPAPVYYREADGDWMLMLQRTIENMTTVRDPGRQMTIGPVLQDAEVRRLDMDARYAN
jgi:hypothetical protein